MYAAAWHTVDWKASADLDVVHASRGHCEAWAPAEVRVRRSPGVLCLALCLVDVQVVHQYNVILRLQQPVAAPLQAGGLLRMHGVFKLGCHGSGLLTCTRIYPAMLCDLFRASCLQPLSQRCNVNLQGELGSRDIHLLPLFSVRMSVIAVEHLNIANLQAHPLISRTLHVKGTGRKEVQKECMSQQKPAVTNLELLVCFSDCLSICLLPPVVRILPEETNSSSIKQKEGAPWPQQHTSGHMWSQRDNFLAHLYMSAVCLTWWQVWGIPGHWEVVIGVVHEHIADFGVLEPGALRFVKDFPDFLGEFGIVRAQALRRLPSWFHCQIHVD